MKDLRLILLLLLLTFSESSYTQEHTKMQAVVKNHDMVMAKMPDLMKLIGKLQPRADSTDSGRNYLKAISALKASNKSMMTWMQGFGERFTADEMMKGAVLSKQKKIWLIEEEKKLNELDKDVSLSIEKAKRLLEKGM